MKCVFLSSLTATLAVASAHSIGHKSSFKGWKAMDTLFFFGDSYTATGFNLTDGSPLPTKSNPLGNPPFPGWNSANGPNWVGYMTTTYNKTKLTSWNVAYGGATIDASLVTPWKPEVLSLKDQVDTLFLPYLAKPKPALKLKWKAEKSLFLIWIGINDIGNSYWNGDFDIFHAQLLDVYFGLVDKLYKAGARNFVFVNVPPTDRSPLMLGQGEWALTTIREALDSFNGKLVEYVKKFERRSKGVYTKVFDSEKVFNDILDHPAKYGFKNTTAYCEAYQNGTPEWDTYDPSCQAPVDEYFWLNSLHPTHLVHKEVARRLVKELS